jgi:hypothetical protein
MADGSLVSAIVDIIKGLDPASLEAKEINRYLKFYADRVSYKWRLGTEKQFSICHLGDDTIRRLIEMPSARNIQRYWVERGENRETSGWSNNEWYYNRRGPYVVVLEEAEYRGILTDTQKAWARVKESKGRGAAKLLTFDSACNERAHDIVFVNSGWYTCINCRRKVTREEVLVTADRQLRGRLRQFAC